MTKYRAAFAALFAVLLALGSQVGAQQNVGNGGGSGAGGTSQVLDGTPVSGALSAAQPTPGTPVAGGTISTSTSGYGGVLVQFTGTVSGVTFTPEGSADGGTTWTALAVNRLAGGGGSLTTEAPSSGSGYFFSVGGFNVFRVRATVYGSTPANVTLVSTTQQVVTTPGGGNVGGSLSAQYNAPAPTYASGATSTLQTDASGNLYITTRSGVAIPVTFSGALPTGSNSIGSITNSSFGATQSGAWNVGVSNFPATQNVALTGVGTSSGNPLFVSGGGGGGGTIPQGLPTVAPAVAPTAAAYVQGVAGGAPLSISGAISNIAFGITGSSFNGTSLNVACTIGCNGATSATVFPASTPTPAPGTPNQSLYETRGGSLIVHDDATPAPGGALVALAPNSPGSSAASPAYVLNPFAGLGGLFVIPAGSTNGTLLGTPPVGYRGVELWMPPSSPASCVTFIFSTTAPSGPPAAGAVSPQFCGPTTAGASPYIYQFNLAGGQNLYIITNTGSATPQARYD